MRKFILISIVMLLGICSHAQTWNIGTPNAADVKAVLSNDTLYIRGTGQMRDYYTNSALWDGNNSITTIVVEEGVSSIGEVAFMGMEALTSVTLPASMRSIGYAAFLNCDVLSSINLNEGLEHISGIAFSGTAISSLFVPKTLTNLDTQPYFSFNIMPKLTEIIVDTDNPDYCSVDGVLYSKDRSTLYIYPEAKSDGRFVVPGFVKKIEQYAFGLAFSNASLKSIVIGKNVPSISFLFILNSSLETTELNVDTIGSTAFGGCENLKTVILDENVKHLDDYAISLCLKLTSVTIKNPTPPTVSSNAFEDTPIDTCTLYVPCGSLNAYQSAPVWQDFGTIKELPCEAGVSNVKASFACPGQVTVTYDLGAVNPTDVTLYYSPDGGKTWLTAQTVSGDLTAQTTGAGKTIVWDSRTDHVRWGNFKLKVEVPQPKPACGTVNSSLPVGKLTFLCYNLGADPNLSIEKQMQYPTTSKADATVYGDLYQWGRNTDGHEKRNSTIITSYPNNLSATDVPGHGNFIVANTTESDWRKTPNDNIWDNPKTVNDPCPQGYRIPTREEWESIKTVNTWTWSDEGTPGMKISPDSGTNYTLFLPATGYRDGSTNGALGGIVGLQGTYWSSTSIVITNPITEHHYAYIFDFSSSGFQTSNGSTRAAGRTCRCVKEY